MTCQNEFDPQLTDTYTPSMHQKLTKHEKFSIQNNQLQAKILVDLQDDYFININSESTCIKQCFKYQVQWDVLKSSLCDLTSISKSLALKYDFANVNIE